VLDGEDLRENIRSMLRSTLEGAVADALAAEGGTATQEALRVLAGQLEGIYFARDTLAGRKEQLVGLSTRDLSALVLELAENTYAAKEASLGERLMRELERVIMLRVVDEYWMDNIDAMDDLKQGIGLRAYGQHDPVIAYKEEGYEMFQAMITAIRTETVRRLFLAQLRPRQEVRREKVAKETGTSGTAEAALKPKPIRNTSKVGPNDPCPCGSGKKYKKCCMQKDKTSGMEQ